MTDAPRIQTLMLIEDNNIDQMMYKRIIDRSGMVGTLQQYFYADEALEYLKSTKEPKPDLILLDINLPRMDGFEFLNAATGELGEEFCPVVVMLTTSLDPNDMTRAKQHASVKEFINKPLTLELMRHLSALV